MVASPIFLTLEHKKQLTHDVYELHYLSEGILSILPGQFLLCDTAGDPKLRRSYSVSWAEGNSVYFIIKRVPNGTGGSVAICDQEIGHKMQVWGPMGRFILQENEYPKVFIGTGTGFAPLYFMLKHLLEQRKEQREKSKKEEFLFVFGVRELHDVFYEEELQQWGEEGGFEYEIYCSRETSDLPEKHHRGRVTDLLKDSVKAPFLKGDTHDSGEGDLLDSDKNKSSVTPASGQLLQKGAYPDTEYYICGSPAMVTEVRGILKNSGVPEEKVFFEQY